MKYHSQKVEADGIRFDSKKEYERYCELQLLEKAGKIQNLRRQVKYVLIPEQREPDIINPNCSLKKGKLLERECSYFADFVYEENGETIVEDVKGFRTKEYGIKKKLMLYMHGVKIRET